MRNPFDMFRLGNGWWFFSIHAEMISQGRGNAVHETVPARHFPLWEFAGFMVSAVWPEYDLPSLKAGLVTTNANRPLGDVQAAGDFWFVTNIEFLE